MPTFVVLAKFTDQGARDIKSFRQNVERNMQTAQALGISTKGFYLTQGEYDLVIIAEAPDEEAVMAQVLTVASRGGARTTTMRAFTLEDLDRIIAKMPG